VIILKDLLLESKLHKFKGAKGTKSKRVQMCHLNSRKVYFKLTDSGKKVAYMEGEVYVPMEDGEYKWIDHAWNIIDGEVHDFTYGSNDYPYRGYVVKDDYMTKIPKWMEKFADDPDDYKDINIGVGKEFGKLNAYK
jgi:hypothetical protein